MKLAMLVPVVLAALLPSCATISEADYAPAAPPASRSSSAEGERVVRTGSMHIKSRDLKKSSEVCVALVASHKATVESARLTEDDYHATIRVPGPSLKPLMESLGEIGTVTSQQVSAENVTAEYRDLEALLQNKRALRDRLRAMLEKATTVKEMLAIEKELSAAQTELDQLEAKMKLLRSRTALATLRVDIDRERIPGPLGIATKSSGWVLKKLFVLN